MESREIQIINAETGQVSVRQMTSEETAQAEKDAADFAAYRAEREAARAASLAKLEALGLTVDDLAALGV